MNNIKDYREKEQKMYIIANVIVLIMLSSLTNMLNDQTTLFVALVKIVDISLLSSIIYIYAFLADAFISSEIKWRLLYFKGHLPGETIFSKLKEHNTDLRFTTEKVLVKYKEIYDNMPMSKKEQYRYENEQWYKIYNRYRDISMISGYNKEYLLCRDLYITTISIFICYVISCMCLSAFYLNIKFVIYLLFMGMITNVSAHIKGKRFVMNVLAYDLHIDDK